MNAGFNDRVAALAKAAGSQRALARWMGISGPAITAWLGGSEPFESTLRDICERTGINYDWFKYGSGSGRDSINLAAQTRKIERPIQPEILPVKKLAVHEPPAEYHSKPFKHRRRPHRQITWKEFKEAVEGAGVKDDDEIFYIDTGNYPRLEHIKVQIEPKEGHREFTVIE